MRAAVAVLAVALATPAVAARCPHGQILRVTMHRCVSVYSALARGYVRPPRKRIVVALPARRLINDGVYYPAPFDSAAELLRERLAHPARPLTREEILLSRAAALVQ